MLSRLRTKILEHRLVHGLASRFGLQQWLFSGSEAYWEQRYRMNGTSGEGSYGRLADFKAEVLNAFVVEHGVERVLEFGCGDGNQLSLARYPSYVGLDVSRAAIERCRERFANDIAKSFFLYAPRAFVDRHNIFRAELSLSLDVLYHLVEDEVFELYMHHLFDSSSKFVIVYASDHDGRSTAPHVRHRHFSAWCAARRPDFKLLQRIPNRYKFSEGERGTSFADFAIFQRVGSNA